MERPIEGGINSQQDLLKDLISELNRNGVSKEELEKIGSGEPISEPVRLLFERLYSEQDRYRELIHRIFQNKKESGSGESAGSLNENM